MDHILGYIRLLAIISGKVLFSDNTITSAMPVKHGYAPVKSQGKWGIVNLRGEWIVQPQYEDIEIL